MKALTLHQPWATLVALGYKTILTPAWSTEYRGPLAVHAAAKRPFNYEHRDINSDIPGFYDHVGLPWEWWEYPDDPRHGGLYKWNGPLGAIVATCELVDVVPIIDPDNCEWHIEHPRSVGACTHAAIDDQVILHTPEGRHHTTVLVESPYGDFTPGRFAWLLDDIRPVDPPVPCKGRQGLWEWDQ